MISHSDLATIPNRPLVVLGLGSAERSLVPFTYWACPRCYWEPETVDLEVVNSVRNLWCPSCNQVSNREAWGHTGHWIRGHYRLDLPDHAYRPDPVCDRAGVVGIAGKLGKREADQDADQSDQIPWYVYIPLTVMAMILAAIALQYAVLFFVRWFGL